MQPSLPARLPQAAAAHALLDQNHALVRLLERITVRLEQSAVVLAILSASAVALAAGVSDAFVAVVACAVTQLALTASLVMLASDRRACVRQLIAEGRGSLPLAVVQRERQRLLARTTRTQLARSLETIADEVEGPVWRPAYARPLYAPRVVVAVAPELRATARQLDSDQVRLSGVAMAERLVNAHNSPLYGRDPVLLRQALHRIRFVLGAYGERPGPAD